MCALFSVNLFTYYLLTLKPFTYYLFTLKLFTYCIYLHLNYLPTVYLHWTYLPIHTEPIYLLFINAQTIYLLHRYICLHSNHLLYLLLYLFPLTVIACVQAVLPSCHTGSGTEQVDVILKSLKQVFFPCFFFQFWASCTCPHHPRWPHPPRPPFPHHLEHKLTNRIYLMKFKYFFLKKQVFFPAKSSVYCVLYVYLSLSLSLWCCSIPFPCTRHLQVTTVSPASPSPSPSFPASFPPTSWQRTVLPCLQEQWGR